MPSTCRRERRETASHLITTRGDPPRGPAPLRGSQRLRTPTLDPGGGRRPLRPPNAGPSPRSPTSPPAQRRLVPEVAHLSPRPTSAPSLRRRPPRPPNVGPSATSPTSLPARRRPLSEIADILPHPPLAPPRPRRPLRMVLSGHSTRSRTSHAARSRPLAHEFPLDDHTAPFVPLLFDHTSTFSGCRSHRCPACWPIQCPSQSIVARTSVRHAASA